MRNMADRKMIVYLTDEPEKVLVKKFVSLKEGAEHYSLGRNTFCALVKEAGVGYKIGSRVLVNTEELEAYMQRYKIQEDE